MGSDFQRAFQVCQWVFLKGRLLVDQVCSIGVFKEDFDKFKWNRRSLYLKVYYFWVVRLMAYQVKGFLGFQVVRLMAYWVKGILDFYVVRFKAFWIGGFWVMERGLQVCFVRWDASGSERSLGLGVATIGMVVAVGIALELVLQG